MVQESKMLFEGRLQQLISPDPFHPIFAWKSEKWLWFVLTSVLPVGKSFIYASRRISLSLGDDVSRNTGRLAKPSLSDEISFRAQLASLLYNTTLGQFFGRFYFFPVIDQRMGEIDNMGKRAYAWLISTAGLLYKKISFENGFVHP